MGDDYSNVNYVSFFIHWLNGCLLENFLDVVFWLCLYKHMYVVNTASSCVIKLQYAIWFS